MPLELVRMLSGHSGFNTLLINLKHNEKKFKESNMDISSRNVDLLFRTLHQSNLLNSAKSLKKYRR